MSDRETRDLGVAHPVEPEVAEVKALVRVYVSAADRASSRAAYAKFGERLSNRGRYPRSHGFEVMYSWDVPYRGERDGLADRPSG